MNEEVLRYIQRQIALGRQRLRRFVFDPAGQAYPRRSIFIKSWSYLEKFLQGNVAIKRWVIIPGLRGTGKTTILAQTYYQIDATLADSVNLLYFSMDEARETVGASLADVLAQYEAFLGESYENVSKPTVILIDEVQSDPNWAVVLKALNDRTSKVFLLCSGSSAVHLQINADISGRRAAIEKLYPMNFCEYQMVHKKVYPDTGLKRAIKSAIYESSNAAEVYAKLQALQPRVDKYWAKVDRSTWRFFIGAGTLPFALAETSVQDIYDAILASVDKVITKDIQALGKFDTDTITAIKRLLFLLAENDVMSVHKLSIALGLHRNTLESIFDVLVQAELLIRVPAYGSAMTASTKPNKYLFMSPTVRVAFFNLAGSIGTSMVREGRVLEDVAGLHYYREVVSVGLGTLSYDSAMGGADFVLKLPSSQIAIEIGRGHKTTRQIEDTMKRVACKYGLVISETALTLNTKETIVCVPWDFFALI